MTLPGACRLVTSNHHLVFSARDQVGRKKTWVPQTGVTFAWLDQMFNGSAQTRKTAIGVFRLKAQAQKLMEMVTEDGMTTAGPTFEYVTHAITV